MDLWGVFVCLRWIRLAKLVLNYVVEDALDWWSYCLHVQSAETIKSLHLSAFCFVFELGSYFKLLASLVSLCSQGWP